MFPSSPLAAVGKKVDTCRWDGSAVKCSLLFIKFSTIQYCMHKYSPLPAHEHAFDLSHCFAFRKHATHCENDILHPMPRQPASGRFSQTRRANDSHPYSAGSGRRGPFTSVCSHSYRDFVSRRRPFRGSVPVVASRGLRLHWAHQHGTKK